MTDLKKAMTIIRWSARVSGTLMLLFVLFFVFAHVFGDSESGEGFSNTKEVLSFICFPIATTIGLSLALKWEGLGGLITLLGMIGLLALRPDLLKSLLIMIPILPGFLYILYWGMRHKYLDDTN